ncbi:hypothetical protein ES319_A11G196500v1 [Gossypium barbadense]|uniref:Cupin type-1 domain-containing protein n=2 Tax=Gossypium TaxID=3633 RepID=A0A5J5TQ39_GOSBA|nr:hypothetical protein ES319_A11G196500v1 [Gossypium barbadense]TYG94730.1 hypothetical protein ES288_A11G211300v1 [Gossypium darwinii]
MLRLKGTLVSPFSFFAVFSIILASPTFLSVESYSHRHASTVGQLVLKHDRKLLTQTEHGEISAAIVTDGTKGPYHLQFITLEPNSVFLPVLLHANMVFFVHTGSGTLSWTDDDDMRDVNLRKGDVYRLPEGSAFYVQSSLEAEREKLRIYAIFTNAEDDIYKIQEPSIGAYSSITDVVLGFDTRVLQAAFKVPEDVIEIMRASKPPAIIHAVQKEGKMLVEWQAQLLKAFLGGNRDGFFHSINGKKTKKKMRAYNVLEADPDFENCNGWSLTVDRKDLQILKHSNIGLFMVNLTKGSMMAPHWNPRASEIAIVLQGQGMVRVVCSSNAKECECRDMRYRVKEGDIFAVPRFHPMAQMSFNNDSFVFMGFSTLTTKRNHPQFLVGKKSALRIMDKQILALSFNVSNATIDQLLKPQRESVILDCTSCAEEEERLMMEEIERERKEEEEARRKEEEEEARKRREEEEAKKKAEEEAQKRREEEEEARRREEEEEAKRREEKEARRREEEEEAKRRREEEEAKRRREEEEEAKRREEKEARRREEEEEEARRREEEEEARTEEEEEARRREEEDARRREEEEGATRRETKKRREEEARREQEEAWKQEEERQRRAEEAAAKGWREREKQRGQPEEKETEGGGDEGRDRRRAAKKVWLI